MKNKQRTTIDWSKHKVHYSESQNAKVWSIKKTGTNHDMVTFINSSGVMSVTGDYGNWVFCREFWPMGEKVSEGYWLEKLRISSDERGLDFDEKGTENDLINAMIDLILGNDESIFWDMEERELEAIKPQIKDYCSGMIGEIFLNLSDYENDLYTEWNIENIKSGLEYYAGCYGFLCDDIGQNRYEIYAYDNLPDGWDYEDVILSREIKHSLKAVFDAYDEIVRRFHETKNAHEYFKIMGVK